jgi:integrase
MGIQRRVTSTGEVRYKARIKSHGREIATRTFTRRADAKDWEQEQTRKLRHGEWIDPKRGRAPLSAVATEWLGSRQSKKRRTYEADEADWRLHVGPRFANMPVVSITTSEVSNWVGGLVTKGCSASSATRYLNTLRSILKYAVSDGRVSVNVAAGVEAPSGGQARREGQFLTVRQLEDLASACHGPYAELVLVLGMGGLRWGELAGLQVGDLVHVPGRGLRLQRAVVMSGAGGELFVDTLKNSALGPSPWSTTSFRLLIAGLTARRPTNGCSVPHVAAP